MDANFGVSISRQQVEIHDPAKRCSKGLAKRWVYLFHDTRAAFHRTMADIPIANRSYRLRVLDKMAVDAEEAFGSAKNTTASGNPVPICIGRRRWGGAIISASIYAEDQM